jgi:heme/copper-type cytochrome/quinol oxidase subunit 3
MSVPTTTAHPEAGPGHDEHGGHITNTGISIEKLGMWVFLGSECLLFGGLISTYLLYKDKLRTFPGFEGVQVNRLGAHIFDLPFTSVSSFVLLMSSLTMVL